MAAISRYYNANTRVFWHVAFWLAYLLYHVLIYGWGRGDYIEALFWEASTLPVKMGVTYFTLYVLLPRYFMSRRFIRFFMYCFLTLMAAALLQRMIDLTLINRWLSPGAFGAASFFSSKILYIIVSIYPVVVLAAFIKVGKHWYERDRDSRELQKENLESELKFLRAQTHPHFLFNTLNNLYALTLKKSDDASEVVLKLSNLLNYMLYEGNGQTVPLGKELELIETYISLEKIRYGDRLDVSYDVTGSTAGKIIPPMLILPFVENSFKHGVSRQLEHVWVTIDVDVEDDRLSLKVENSVAANSEDTLEPRYRKGIGLTNVKRRLDLLYDSAYELDITAEADTFSIVLLLNLDYVRNAEVA